MLNGSFSLSHLLGISQRRHDLFWSGWEVNKGFNIMSEIKTNPTIAKSSIL